MSDTKNVKKQAKVNQLVNFFEVILTKIGLWERKKETSISDEKSSTVDKVNKYVMKYK